MSLEFHDYWLQGDKLNVEVDLSNNRLVVCTFPASSVRHRILSASKCVLTLSPMGRLTLLRPFLKPRRRNSPWPSRILSIASGGTEAEWKPPFMVGSALCGSYLFELWRTTAMSTFTLKDHELGAAEVHHNLPPSSLYEHAIRFEKDASIAENGALVAYSGAKTGRSPKDKRVSRHPVREGRMVGVCEHHATRRRSPSTASARLIT